MAANKNIETINTMIEKETNNTIKRFRNIQTQALLLLYTDKITEKEYEQIIEKIPIINNPYIDDILTNRIILSDYYKKVIEIYNNYEVNAHSESYNDPNLEALFNDYMKYLNCNKLYNMIKNKGMIIYPKNLKEDGYTLIYGDLSYIILKKNPDMLYTYSCLAHEMGHALSNNTLYNKRNYNTLNTIKTEIISILLEKLFLSYLLSNGTISKEKVSKNIMVTEKKYKYVTQKAKENLDLFDNPNITININNDNIDFTRRNKINTIPLNRNLYAIGNIVSAKIMEESESDIAYFVKHIRSKIIELENLPAEELITKYFD